MSHIGIQFKDKNNNSIYPNPFPIGAIYLSVDSRNPQNIFGGKWEQIKDRFLLMAGNTYSAGATGGSATHKLTSDEMPSHRHNQGARTSDGNWNYVAHNNSGGSTGGAYVATAGWTNNATGYGYTFWTGGSKEHNNMPPYLVVYAWKRVS